MLAAFLLVFWLLFPDKSDAVELVRRMGVCHCAGGDAAAGAAAATWIEDRLQVG